MTYFIPIFPFMWSRFSFTQVLSSGDTTIQTQEVIFTTFLSGWNFISPTKLMIFITAQREKIFNPREWIWNEFCWTVHFFFTFPELLMHLWMQKKTATHAINKVVASGTRISPASQHIMKWKRFVCIMAIHANKQNYLSGHDKKYPYYSINLFLLFH